MDTMKICWQFTLGKNDFSADISEVKHSLFKDTYLKAVTRPWKFVVSEPQSVVNACKSVSNTKYLQICFTAIFLNKEKEKISNNHTKLNTWNNLPTKPLSSGIINHTPHREANLIEFVMSITSPTMVYSKRYLWNSEFVGSQLSKPPLHEYASGQTQHC